MFQELIAGAANTLYLAIVAWAIGLPIGIVLAVLSFMSKPMRSFLRPVVVGFSTLPLLVVLFWLHYPLQTAFSVVWPPMLTSIVALSLFVAISSSGIILQRLIAVDRTYAESIKVLGLDWQSYVKTALFPASWQTSIPQLLTLAIITIQSTMFCSLIGVEELFRVTLRLNSIYLKPVELFLTMGAFYVCLCLPLFLAAARLRARFAEEPELA